MLFGVSLQVWVAWSDGELQLCDADLLFLVPEDDEGDEGDSMPGGMDDSDDGGSWVRAYLLRVCPDGL